MAENEEKKLDADMLDKSYKKFKGIDNSFKELPQKIDQYEVSLMDAYVSWTKEYEKWQKEKEAAEKGQEEFNKKPKGFDRFLADKTLEYALQHDLGWKDENIPGKEEERENFKDLLLQTYTGQTSLRLRQKYGKLQKGIKDYTPDKFRKDLEETMKVAGKYIDSFGERKLNDIKEEEYPYFAEYVSEKAKEKGIALKPENMKLKGDFFFEKLLANYSLLQKLPDEEKGKETIKKQRDEFENWLNDSTAVNVQEAISKAGLAVKESVEEGEED